MIYQLVTSLRMPPKRFQEPIFRKQSVEERLLKIHEDMLPASIWEEQYVCDMETFRQLLNSEVRRG